ncbi:MAG: hypothetical protein JSS53_03770 [Proteobacteria bacterium]|nr:hypothetical protein [Pseudomonadota bacterium]
MKKSILEIYALAVCFVVIICFSVTLGRGIYDVIQIVNPSFTLSSWEYQRYQSNENFCTNAAINKKANCASPNNIETTKMREAAYAIALKGEQRTGFQGLVTSLIVLLVSILIFIPHWMIARKSRD